MRRDLLHPENTFGNRVLGIGGRMLDDFEEQGGNAVLELNFPLLRATRNARKIRREIATLEAERLRRMMEPEHDGNSVDFAQLNGRLSYVRDELMIELARRVEEGEIHSEHDPDGELGSRRDGTFKVNVVVGLFREWEESDDRIKWLDWDSDDEEVNDGATDEVDKEKKVDTDKGFWLKLFRSVPHQYLPLFVFRGWDSGTCLSLVCLPASIILLPGAWLRLNFTNFLMPVRIHIMLRTDYKHADTKSALSTM